MISNLPLHPRTAGDRPVPSVQIVSIDCHDCRAPVTACSDCVVTMLLPDDSAAEPRLSQEERRALTVLSDSGLVPPLRYESGSDASAHPCWWEDPSTAV